MPTAKKPASSAKSTSTAKPAAKTTTATAAAKPAAPATEAAAAKPVRRTRKPVESVAAEAAVAVEPPTEPKKDRTMLYAVSFLAAVALFAAGFGIGRASGGDTPTAVIGNGQVQVGPGMGGMGPYGDDGMHMYPNRPGQGGGRNFPGNGGVVPPATEDQGFLGISGTSAPEGGVAVDEVQSGSAAEAAGLMAGDRIVSMNGMPIIGIGQFATIVSRTQPGTTITLDVDRSGSMVTLSATLGSRAG